MVIYISNLSVCRMKCCIALESTHFRQTIGTVNAVDSANNFYKKKPELINNTYSSERREII